MALCRAGNVLVFVLLLLVSTDAEYTSSVRATIKLASLGDNISLPCNTDRPSNTIRWMKDNQYEIAIFEDSDHPEGQVNSKYRNGHFSQSYNINSSGHQSFPLSIHEFDLEDLGIYKCLYTHSHHELYIDYDVRLDGCSSCLKSSYGSDSKETKVQCFIKDFNTTERIELNMKVNRLKEKAAAIERNVLTFNASRSLINDGFTVEFNPYDDGNTITSNKTCAVPAMQSSALSKFEKMNVNIKLFVTILGSFVMINFS